MMAEIVSVTTPQECCDSEWEIAYRRFATPEQEVRNFLKRYRRIGVSDWSRDEDIVALFCGRGGGLIALETLGFNNLEGVDLSEKLLQQYRGKARCHVADCRDLPFDDATKDIVIIEGGLHHLPNLPEDLELVLSETRRVLTDGGKVLIVEPWITPFLSLAHWGCRRRLARLAWKKLDALATMIEHEIETYEQWLQQPDMILRCINSLFQCKSQDIAWGKLTYVGVKPAVPK